MYTLWLMLANARDAIQELRKKELRKYGISPQQAGILFRIKILGGNTTPAELSRLSFRKANTTTVILKRMTVNGLVKKRIDRKRKNSKRITLTEKGERLYQIATRRESIYKAFSGLSKEQLEQLHDILQIILNTSGKQLKVNFEKFYTLLDK